ATMGDMVGIGFTHLFPGWHLAVGAFALVAMGATFGVGARAQLTGVLFAAEVTGAYSLLVPLLIATAVAELVAQGFLHDRIMTDKLFRRGYRVDLDVDQDPLRARVAGQLMDPGGADVVAGAPVVDRWSFLADCLPVFVDSGAERLAVVDGGEVVGSLSREAVVEVYRLRWSGATRQPGALARRRGDHRSGGEGNGTGDAAPGDGGGRPDGWAATGEMAAPDGDRASGPPDGPRRPGGAPDPGQGPETPEDADSSPERDTAAGRPGRGEGRDGGR
ncbi:MAG TPA: chloride channel protein, partial [Acidimicrobiales bacterium]|nr:chloride channel protein [Acidimicrobiales bacterium]